MFFLKGVSCPKRSVTLTKFLLSDISKRLVVFVIVRFRCAILSHPTELINVTKQSYERLRDIPFHTILETTVNVSYESVFCWPAVNVTIPTPPKLTRP